MRIIAGKYKAKVINSPKTEKTRPTLDRVKEAMFSILIPYTLDANVLDLFSGTGNLGLESISRGAKFAWLNDSSNIAISTIISNVELTNAKTCVKITKKDYIKCLRQIQNQNMYFDIIFLDPPYDSKFAIETLSGTIEVECLNARATEFRVNMGKASFLSREIPVTGEVREVIDESFTFNKKEYKATCLTVGNPHCIIFMDQVSQEKVRELGPYVENADEFPERMNLQICRQVDKGNLEIEIWERGSGYTKASGTGSCAAAAAAYKLGLVESRINVNQPGGMIQIDMEEDGTIYMTGTVGYIADISVAESFFS